jgi:hypothetical protein
MKMRVKLTMTEEMLGTKPADPNVFGTYVASKAPDDDTRKKELESLERIEEIGTTVFLHNNGTPVMRAYQIKGFFKDAAASLNRMDPESRNAFGQITEKLTAHKTKIDQCIFAEPAEIKIQIHAEQTGICERSLRADTPQGPRITLVRSESVPAGSTLEFDILILAKDLEPYVRAWLNYGALRGIGGWRNSEKGRFKWEELKQ